MHSMRAVVFQGHGGTDVIAVGEVPVPSLNPGQVRVRVHAAGINRADVLQRRGGYEAPHGVPADIPGLEFAGEVEAVRGTNRWKIGDRVMGLVGGGAQAELVATNDDELMPVPPSMSYAEAAAVPEAFLTAFDALVLRGRVQQGDRVLIHAVGSGVGTAAVQIAKHLGATVIGTSRTADKLARALVYGIDSGIDTSRERFSDVLHEPVNVILDVIGGPAMAENLAALAPRGRLVMLGFLGGSRADVDFVPVLRRRLEIVGTVMRSRGPEERAALVERFTREMLPLFEHGVLRPVLEREVGPDAVGTAHEAMERNETFGKIVVTW